MSDVVSKLFRKSGLLAASVAFFIVLLFASTSLVLITKPSVAHAATSCSGQVDYPNTAVIYCGLTGKTANDYALSLKSYYDNNTDGRADLTHHDVQAFFKSQGLTGSIMADGHWKLGHTDLKTKQIILDDGTVVGNATAVFARCTSNGNPQCPRDQSGTIVSTSSFYGGKFGNSMPTIIHMNANGVADFAVWSPCGNVAQFTPVIPSSLVCKALDWTINTAEDKQTYTFTVTATSQNYPDFTYYIKYYDGDITANKVLASDSAKVTGQKDGDHTQSFTYAFDRLDSDHLYTIAANVDKIYQPKSPCVKQLTVPAKSKQLVFACQALNALQVSSGNGTVTYRYTASVSGTDTVKNYTFNFSDQSPMVTANNVVERTYNYDTSNPQTFNVSFFATSATGLQTDQNDKNCQFAFKPTSVRTGPAGTMGLIAATTFGGVALHQFLIRRKLTA